MSSNLDPKRVRELALVSALTGIVVFATPLRNLWAGNDVVWWLPFALWTGFILLGFLVDRAAHRHGR